MRLCSLVICNLLPYTFTRYTFHFSNIYDVILFYSLIWKWQFSKKNVYDWPGIFQSVYYAFVLTIILQHERWLLLFDACFVLPLQSWLLAIPLYRHMFRYCTMGSGLNSGLLVCSINVCWTQFIKWMCSNNVRWAQFIKWMCSNNAILNTAESL